MKNDDDAVLEEAADTTAKQLADGWLTWANTCTQQPPPSSTLPKNTGQRHCDLDSCALKQWKRLVQTKEMEDSDLGLSMLSPICDDLPEFDSQGPEFTPVEELNCDPYSPAYTDAICQALDLDDPEYSTIVAKIMKRFKERICQYPTAFLFPGSPLKAVKGFEHRIDTGMPRPFIVTHTRKTQLNVEQSKQKSNGCLNPR